MMKEKTMTKLIVAMGAFTLVATLIIICAMHSMPTSTPTSEDCLYPLTTVVIEVNEDENTVVCEDYKGSLWSFYGIEDWREGDIVSLLMDDMGTATIYDDKIVKTYYSGTTEGLN